MNSNWIYKNQFENFKQNYCFRFEFRRQTIDDCRVWKKFFAWNFDRLISAESFFINEFIQSIVDLLKLIVDRRICFDNCDELNNDYIEFCVCKIDSLINAFIKYFVECIHKKFVNVINKFLNLHIEKIKTKYFTLFFFIICEFCCLKNFSRVSSSSIFNWFTFCSMFFTSICWAILSTRVLMLSRKLMILMKNWTILTIRK